MPIFFQQQINESTRLGVWKIEETEEFFLSNVPLQKDVTHPHKRLQHLAGRFLLQFLFPGFPYDLIKIADTRKPYLPGEEYHFSISHCADYAAAIVSTEHRPGIDIEVPTSKVEKIVDKFLSVAEQDIFNATVGTESSSTGHLDDGRDPFLLTTLWCAKEVVYKWHGVGGVDFRRDIRLDAISHGEQTIHSTFGETNEELIIQYRYFDHLVLAWLIS